MLRPLAGIAIVALLALPVVAQVRRHRAHPTAAEQAAAEATLAAQDAAVNVSMSTMSASDAAAMAAANAEAGGAIGDENVADNNMAMYTTYDAAAYDTNADTGMNANMTMEENRAVEEAVNAYIADSATPIPTPSPGHRRRARTERH